MNYPIQTTEADLLNKDMRVQKSLTGIICTVLPALDRESLEQIREALELSLLGTSDKSPNEASPMELIAKLKARNLSRSKIAKALNLKSWRTVYTWEKGKAIPKDNNLRKLLDLAKQICDEKEQEICEPPKAKGLPLGTFRPPNVPRRF
jgi:DNA-binding transcriptional regulator YiaG